MNTDLIRPAKEVPGLQVTITLAELVEGINIAIDETERRLEQRVADEKAETYLSRAKVVEMLDKSPATLYRGQKAGYLVPLNVGGSKRYRMSDVKRIIEGDSAQRGVVS